MGRLKDALKPTNIWAGTGYAGSNSGTRTGDTSPSRLLVNSTELRNSLESRNLYSDTNAYPLQGNDRQKFVNSVSSILSTVTPFKSFNLRNSVIGRLVSTPTTPLSDIGLIMLGKQFTLNFKSNAIQEALPTVNLRNVFDGNSDTKLFQSKINYSITEREGGGTFEGFIDDFFGYRPRRRNIFSNNPTNTEYLQNTGVGQLDILFGNASNDNSGGLNKNIYKPYNIGYYEAAERSNNNIADRGNIVSNKTWFNFSDKDFYKYLPITIDSEAEVSANKTMRQSYIDSAAIGSNDLRNQEYAPDLNYVDEYFGRTDKSFALDAINAFTNTGMFIDVGVNDVNNQLVWGRDGVSDKANERLKQLRGDVDFFSQDTQTSFNIQTGLLEYTRNLLNATNGKFIDQTRKIYKENDVIKSANGSKLWEAPESALSRFAGKKGIRQHSVLDQYDRFAKAIRFDGNQVYGGNEESVVYNSVLPRIHPVLNKEGEVDNNNLMFSIENLAVVAIGGDDDYGIIDDEYGTRIPRSEVGPFNGRIMWFPPYGISLNETSTATFEPTVMVGRNEPVYTYMHSERSATLSFTMIIDHPEQLKNYMKTGSQKDIAEFFAFGGPDYESQPYLDNGAKKENENRTKKKEIEGPTEKAPPDIELPDSFSVAFPNDVPAIGSSSASVIDTLYNKYKYEIARNTVGADGTSYGLNEKIYLLTGLTLNNDGSVNVTIPAGFTQSNANYIEGERALDDALKRVFNDPDNTRFYKINIEGGATILYTESIEGDVEATNTYNRKIGLARANVTKSFIEERIKKIFPDNANQILEGLVIDVTSEGARSDRFDSEEDKDKIGAKQERTAIIEFVKRNNPPESKEQETTPDEKQDVEVINEENERLKKAENIQGRNSGNDIMNERKASDISNEDDGIMKNYQSIRENKFYPAYFSQTPEDFHKRLTFLQQCTRQGSAIREGAETDEYGIRRAKNSVFGRQPICVLRVADFFYTKVIIENINIDYDETTWDTNPEGFGMQPMIANVTLQMKILGGQSLKGPIDALQNAVSFNYYANSTYTSNGMYNTPSKEAEKQQTYIEGILDKKTQDAQSEYNKKTSDSAVEEQTGNE